MELCALQATPAPTKSFGMENNNTNWRAVNQYSPDESSTQRRMSIATLSSSYSPTTPGPAYPPPSPSHGTFNNRDPSATRLPPLSRHFSNSLLNHSGTQLPSPGYVKENVESPRVDAHRVPQPFPPRTTTSDSSRIVTSSPQSHVGATLDRANFLGKSTAAAKSIRAYGSWSGRQPRREVSPRKQHQGLPPANQFPGDATGYFGNDPRHQPHRPDAVQTDGCANCASLASVTQMVVSGLMNLDLEVQNIVGTRPVPYQSAPDAARDGSWKALNWALETIQETNKSLRQRREHQRASSPHMNDLKRREDVSPFDDHIPKRSRTGSLSDAPGRSFRPAGQGEPGFTTARMQPGALNTPMSMPAEDKAHASYLEELQHDISVKTLAYSTLKREHDSLLQKLERQRAKCATLERKFETSDLEINSLSDEKERLQSQVSVLENQVETIQRDRDDARNQSVANNGQYLKIVELSSRLQKQAAEDKKRWNAERAELLSTIRQAREQTFLRDQPNESLDAERNAAGGDTFERGRTGKQKVSENVSEHKDENGSLDLDADTSDMGIEDLRARNKLLRLALIDVRREVQNIQEATQRINARGDVLRRSLANSGAGSPRNPSAEARKPQSPRCLSPASLPDAPQPSERKDANIDAPT